jgi:hypothetical protein
VTDLSLFQSHALLPGAGAKLDHYYRPSPGPDTIGAG